MHFHTQRTHNFYFMKDRFHVIAYRWDYHGIIYLFIVAAQRACSTTWFSSALRIHTTQWYISHEHTCCWKRYNLYEMHSLSNCLIWKIAYSRFIVSTTIYVYIMSKLLPNEKWNWTENKFADQRLAACVSMWCTNTLSPRIFRLLCFSNWLTRPILQHVNTPRERIHWLCVTIRVCNFNNLIVRQLLVNLFESNFFIECSRCLLFLLSIDVFQECIENENKLIFRRISYLFGQWWLL